MNSFEKLRKIRRKLELAIQLPLFRPVNYRPLVGVDTKVRRRYRARRRLRTSVADRHAWPLKIVIKISEFNSSPLPKYFPSVLPKNGGAKEPRDGLLFHDACRSRAVNFVGAQSSTGRALSSSLSHSLEFNQTLTGEDLIYRRLPLAFPIPLPSRGAGGGRGEASRHRRLVFVRALSLLVRASSIRQRG